MKLILKCFAAGIVIGALVSCSKFAPTGTAITNVTVIDAVNGVRDGYNVVWDGDEIKGVYAPNVEIDVAESIDGTGKFLIPGLWDFHVHLSYDDRFTATMPADFLAWGITSVRDTGGLMHKVLPIVEAMRADGAVAPRVYFAGPLLDGRYVVYDGNSRPEIGVQNMTPDVARATVHELKSQGVDFIKVYEMVSPDVFDALVETANELGLPIDSHVPLSLRASTAGPKVDSIEHLRNIEMDCAANAPELHETRLEHLKNPGALSGYALRSSLHSLQRLAAIADYDEDRCDETLAALAETMQVPTLRLNGLALVSPFEREDWNDAFARLPADVQEDWGAAARNREVSDDPEYTRFAEWSLFLIGRMYGKGIPIGAGTDTPIGWAAPGYSLHSELEMLVRAGLPPIEALRAATLRPAEYFSLDDRMGTIERGMRADLVLLDADPLRDIENTKRISLVVSKGRQFTPESLAGVALNIP